jgi:hypothetical protein
VFSGLGSGRGRDRDGGYGANGMRGNARLATGILSAGAASVVGLITGLWYALPSETGPYPAGGGPAATATIPVTIAPSGPAGTVVRGTLYVDDFVDSMQFLSGSQLLALPYTYTVG